MTTGPVTCATGMNLNFAQDRTPGQRVEPKVCEFCSKTFYRGHVVLRTLKDGTVLDPNRYCPSCEHMFATAAAKAEKQIEDANAFEEVKKPAPDPEDPEMLYGDVKWSEERWQRECGRKEFFDSPQLALKIAARSRSRHRGKAPCSAYKCRAKIDPINHPERAVPHWHIGGPGDRKL